MNTRELRSLQAMINRTVSASNSYQVASTRLLEWCREHYGYEPADVDADDILDSVLGLAGMASTMTAEDFDKSMTRATP